MLVLLQRLQVRDDVSDLLVAETGLHRRAELRVELVEADRRHQHTRLHLPGVLDPEREMPRVVREKSRGDCRATADVRQVRSDLADHARVAANRMATEPRALALQ